MEQRIEKKNLLGYRETQPERGCNPRQTNGGTEAKKTEKAKLGGKTYDSVAGRRGLGPDPDDGGIRSSGLCGT